MSIFDKELLAHILALQYAEGVKGVVANIIIDLGFQIADMVKDQPTDFQSWRLAAMAQEANDLANTYIKSARDTAEAGVVDSIPVFEKMAIAAINDNFGYEVAKPVITEGVIQTITSDAAVLGQPSAEWWSQQPAAIRDRFIQIIRTGQVSGLTVAEMTNRVLGSTGGALPTAGVVTLTRIQAETLVRTSIANSNNLTKLIAWQNNGDAIDAIQWVATLDNRTTPICRALDGKQWKIADFSPIGHDFPFPGPVAHWNCRSTQIPVPRSLESMATKNKDLAAELDRRLSGGERAAAWKPAPKQMTFADWLKSQTPGVQKQILGYSKWKLWNSGAITIDSMVSADLKALTLDQLKSASKAYPSYVKASHLDSMVKSGLIKQADEYFLLKQYLTEIKPYVDERLIDASPADVSRIVTEAIAAQYQGRRRKFLFDVDTLHPLAAQEAGSTMLRMSEVFKDVWEAGYGPPNVYTYDLGRTLTGVYEPGLRTVRLNEKKLGPKTYLRFIEDSINHSIDHESNHKDRWVVEESSGATMAHEIGHFLDFTLSDVNHPASKTWNDGRYLLVDGVSEKDVEKNISLYAASNDSELVAEVTSSIYKNEKKPITEGWRELFKKVIKESK